MGSRLSLASPTSGRFALARQTGVARLGTALLDLVYPPRCPLTDEPVTRHGAFSARAWSAARLIGAPWCEACGRPFAVGDPTAPLCGPCAAPGRVADGLTGPRRLDRVRSALAYDEGTGRLIMGLKYGDRHDQVAALAALMARVDGALFSAPVLLVPVPLHRRRLAARRFNQAALLSGALSRSTGHPHAPDLLMRVRPTPKQKGLSPAARRRNVAGAFAIRPGRDVRGRRVLLVDDVLTTGATLVACARTLRRAGAAGVDAVTVARVLKD